MDINNVPPNLARFGLLEITDIDVNKDLIVISKKLNNLRNGTQFRDLSMTVAEFLKLVPNSGGGVASITFNRTYLQMKPNATISDTFASALPVGKIPLAYKITNVVPFVCGIDPAMTANLTLLNSAAEQIANPHNVVALPGASGPVNAANNISSGLLSRFTMSAGVVGAITIQITGVITLPLWNIGDLLRSSLDGSTTANILSITQTALTQYDIVLTNIVEGATTWQDTFTGGGDALNASVGEQAPVTAYTQAPSTPTTINDLTAGEYSVEVWYL
jgi:hypothetical protein